MFSIRHVFRAVCHHLSTSITRLSHAPGRMEPSATAVMTCVISSSTVSGTSDGDIRQFSSIRYFSSATTPELKITVIYSSVSIQMLLAQEFRTPSSGTCTTISGGACLKAIQRHATTSQCRSWDAHPRFAGTNSLRRSTPPGVTGLCPLQRA
jgi:hypothetical protein